MSRLTKWFRKPARPERRQPVRLRVETLEDRLVPSVNFPTDLAQIPYTPPNGPTQLGICFEGSAPYSDGGYLGIGQKTYQVGAYNAGTPTLTDQNIQDMIFRVSEIYAPFNVQVTRLLGYNDYWNGSTTQGPSTVFVGPDLQNSVGAGVTPGSFSDYPSLGNMNDVRHSEPYHLAYVDPNQGNFGSTTGAAESIAHEASHTFGLWHVRTDISLPSGNPLSDPAALNNATATVPDIMSYNRVTPLEYFADQSLNLTAWNAPGPKLQGASMPVYSQNPPFPQIQPTTQDSFYCLGQVLGARPGDGRYHVADIGAIDPQYRGQFVHPGSDDMNAADAIITEQGTIFRQGDYDVYRWTAPTNETIRVNLAGQGGLSPLLMVYDNTGQVQWQNGGSQPANSSDILVSDTGNNLLYIQDSLGGRGQLQAAGAPAGTLNVQAGTSYYFVIGAQDSDSTGSYQLGINQMPAWAQLSGTTLSINGNVLGANATEALSIDSNIPGKLLVSLNGTTAQFEPGQVSAINVNSLGGNNQINLAPGILDLSSLPSQITVAAGVYTALTVHDNNNAAASTYSVTATGLNRAIGGQPLFTVRYGSLTSLTLDTGLAPDTVNIDTIPASTTVVGGPLFTDQFNIGATSHSLDGLGSSSLTLDGGSGGATVVLNDSGHVNPYDLLLSYSVTGSSVQRSEMYWDPATGFDDSSFVTVNYSRVKHLELGGSTWFPALVSVESTSAPTDIHGGSQVIVTPTSQTLNSINGLLSIFGGYLTIDDMANPYGRGIGATVSYAVDSVSLSRSIGFLGRPPAVATVIQYMGLSGLTLDTCIASNKVVVSGTPAPTTINCGAADAVLVGDFLGTLGTLTVNGHGGTLTLDDSVTANSDGPIGGMDGTQSFAVGFTVTDQSVAYHAHEVERYYYEPPNGGPGKWVTTTANFASAFHYANVSALTIDGGPVDNSFGVQSTPAGMKLTLNGSTGQEVNGALTFNHFTVGNSGSVKNIRSQLVFNGSGPADTVLLDDSAATTQDIVTVTPSQVGMGALDKFFASGGGLTYNGISALTLNLSAAYDDEVHLTPSAETAFFLKANESEWQAGHGAILDLDPADGPYTTDHQTGLDAGYLTFSNGKKSVMYSGFAQY